MGWYRVNGLVPQGGRMVSPECVLLVELLGDSVETLCDRRVMRLYFLLFFVILGPTRYWLLYWPSTGST